MNETCVLTIKEKKMMDAGIKAKKDISKFLSAENIEQINLEVNLDSKLSKFFFSNLILAKAIRNSVYNNFFFQYPAYSAFIEDKVAYFIKKYHRQAKFFIIIHDVESLRLFRNAEFKNREINFFNQSAGLIVHNDKMKQWLLNNGVKVEMVSLEAFDYDNPQPLNSITNQKWSICFAGNLKKATFIKKLDLKHELYIYGSRVKKVVGNVRYCGRLDPDILPKYLRQSFGLIWDGTSLNQCDGVFGEYLKYNNPHKMSLYLSSGLPVIVWKQAAVADFVEKNQVGITINRLSDLDEILDKLSIDDYRQLKENVVKIAKGMRNGVYIKRAVKNLLALEKA